MNPQTNLQFWLTIAGEFNSERNTHCYLCNGSKTFEQAWKDLEIHLILRKLGKQFFSESPPPEEESQHLCPSGADALFEAPGFNNHRKIRNRFLLWNIQRLMHS